ncbi:hypothetical protein HNQ56_002880 [Anaerotaenia torta]|uniref:hypothetical protein n=1 Tax=Anaerotaenia torta TaxID=433293 RepID=UPI003D2584D5
MKRKIKYTNFKKKFLLQTAGPIIILAAVLIIILLLRPKDTEGFKKESRELSENEIASVNGWVITSEEFLLYTQAYSVNVQDETLRKEALQKILLNKLIQAEAYHKGLTDIISYEDLMAKLEEENEIRKKKVADNQVIYGIQTYSPPIYYTYFISNIKNNLENELEKEGKLGIDPKELYRFYEETKDQYARKDDAKEVYMLRFTATEEGMEEVDKIFGELDTSGHFTDLYHRYEDPEGAPGYLIEAKRMRVDEDKAYYLKKYDNSLYDAIYSLNDQETCFVADDLSGGLLILHCAVTETSGYYDYEEVKDEIEIRYKEIIYEKYLEELYGKARIEFNDKAVNKSILLFRQGNK